MNRTTPMQHFYPEIQAGGFSHVSSTIDFFNRVNALLSPEMVVLDYGAGRGVLTPGTFAYANELKQIKGKVRRFIGVDVDPIVKENTRVDESLVIMPGERLPFEDQSIDLVISDWVFEHIPEPAAVVKELHRVLRPGGWVCARTPNRWGYVVLSVALIPEWLHASVLRKAQPHRSEQDVFPKYYQMNSLGRIAREFGAYGFESYSYTVNSEPAYAGGSRLLFRAFLVMHRLTPPGLDAYIHAFLKKT